MACTKTLKKKNPHFHSPLKQVQTRPDLGSSRLFISYSNVLLFFLSRFCKQVTAGILFAMHLNLINNWTDAIQVDFNL